MADRKPVHFCPNSFFEAVEPRERDVSSFANLFDFGLRNAIVDWRGSLLVDHTRESQILKRSRVVVGEEIEIVGGAEVKNVERKVAKGRW